MSRRYTMIVYSNPVAGREDECGKWPDEVHLASSRVVTLIARRRQQPGYFDCHPASVRSCWPGEIADADGAPVLITAGAYELDDDPARVDRDAVWEFLSTEAYWGKSRTRADFERQFAGAWRVVGAYTAAGDQAGFARAVSDAVAFAYLADVFVVPDARGRGLGKELVATMIDRGPGAHFRWTLHTSDAHGLYRQYGFAEPGPTLLERPYRPRAAP